MPRVFVSGAGKNFYGGWSLSSPGLFSRAEAILSVKHINILLIFVVVKTCPWFLIPYFFLVREVQWYSGENPVERRWRGRKSKSFSQEVWGEICKLCTSVSSVRFFVQRSGFLRNRISFEAMKCAMRMYSKLKLILKRRSKATFTFHRHPNLRSEDGIEWR